MASDAQEGLLFDRPLSRDPILLAWTLLNVSVAAFALNEHTTWSGSVEWPRVTGFVQDVITAATLSFLFLALLPALVRRRFRGPIQGSRISAQSAWVAGTHASCAHPDDFVRRHPYRSGIPRLTWFDRPLRRDPLLVVWLLVNVVVAFVALDANTTWSGSVESARVASFFADVIVVSLASFVLLCLLPAWLRWKWRGRSLVRWDGEQSQWRHGRQHGPGSGSGHGRTAMDGTGAHRQHTSWSHSSHTRSHVMHSGHATAAASQLAMATAGTRVGVTTPWSQSPEPCADDARSVSAISRTLPSFRMIDLPAGPLPVGVPVPLSWATKGAHSVTINGHPGYPPSGSAAVLLDEAGQCHLTARGPGQATRHASTAPVPMLDVPTPHIHLPPGPGLNLQAQVDMSDGRESLQTTLLALTEARLTFRPTVESTPAPRPAQESAANSNLNLRALLGLLSVTTPPTSRPHEAADLPGEL